MGFELSDILKDHIQELSITKYQKKVLSRIINCRTQVMGTHKLKCTNKDCSAEEYSYDSCRDRHCPKCMGSKQIKWVHKRIQETLLVRHAHLVFTIPNSIKSLFLLNKAQCYSILFNAVKNTIFEVTKKNNKFKGEPGFYSILHTWSQILNLHPHIHCFIPLGGIDVDKKKWIDFNDNKFFNKEYLSSIFKISLIKEFRKSNLEISEELIEKANNAKFKVYIKTSLRDPAEIISYLGQFLQKVAITNNRITSYDGHNVTFSYKDRSDGNKVKYKDLDVKLFLKRFIMHILPNKFTKIRYYGFLSNSKRKKYQKIIKTISIKDSKISVNKKIRAYIENLIELFNSPPLCSCCNQGHMVLFGSSP